MFVFKERVLGDSEMRVFLGTEMETTVIVRTGILRVLSDTDSNKLDVRYLHKIGLH